MGRGSARAVVANATLPEQALAARRMYYWSVRYSGFEATQFFANGTAALQSALNDSQATTYVNLFNVKW